MKVSIIIPTYNRANIITTAIQSIVEQTYEDWECIIIDDGSTDKSLDILSKHEARDYRIKVITRDRLPKGAPTCRNIGLKHAKGKYIIFLDSDDYLLPYCIETRIEEFNKNIDNDFLVFPMAIKRHQEIIKSKIPSSSDYLVNFLSAELPWSIMCPIWKRSTLLLLNGFTEGYPRFNDPELMIRSLLLPNIQYKVFKDLSYDCVHLPSNKEYKKFNDKVFKSLKKFVPEITKHLIKNERTELISRLSNYLHLWFKYFYIPSNSMEIIKSIKLINLFRKHRVISTQKSINITFRLLLYVFSKYFSNPMDKLSDKAIYN